ncbi:MAG: MerR family transcriptional regulator [Chloroflexi bacterium]|nr:MerR family transcriptional regulator [Chloroflexota bacterium]
MFSKSPAYNLKAVLRETGLAADTSRARERRYGLPAPRRGAGGHRLYSQYDIEIVKWLIARRAEGLSISRAVDLWNEITASGSGPLAGLAPSSLAALTVPRRHNPRCHPRGVGYGLPEFQRNAGGTGVEQSLLDVPG